MKRRPAKKRARKPSKLPATPKRPTRGSVKDEDYLDYIRSQPCLVTGCWSPSEAHHYGKSGMGFKCDDYETCPLCAWHHRGEFHQHGHLVGLTREESIELFKRSGEELLAVWEMTNTRKEGRMPMPGDPDAWMLEDV